MFVLFCQRYYYRLLGKEIVHFIHIGKTGGTALKHAFDGHVVTRSHFVKTHLHHFHLKHIPEGEKFFFSIRDPKDRFISAFYARQREDKPKFYLPHRKGEARAFSTFNTPNELALALSSQDSDLRSKAEDAMQSIIHLKESYWDWLEDETYFMKRMPDLMLVCHLKSLAHDFSRLKEEVQMSDAAKLPEPGVNSHSSSDKLDKKLEPHAVENLHNWYAKDYRLMEILEEHKWIQRFE